MFWYEEIRAISGLNDAGLDRKCFGEDCGRRRYFEGIRRSWSSPDARPIVDGRTVLQVVDSWDTNGAGPGPYANATRNFRSKLWDFLANPDASPDDYTAHIQDYVSNHGLVRLSWHEVRLYRMLLGTSEPAVQNGALSHSAMLQELIKDRTIDALSVLIALFREAMAAFSLDRAVATRSAVRLCMNDMMTASLIPPQVEALFGVLIEARVLNNCWVSDAEWRSRAEGCCRRPSSTERNRDLIRWINWYISHATMHVPIYGEAPIASRTAGISWVEQNRDALVRALWHKGQAETAESRYASDHLAEVTRIFERLPPRPGAPPARRTLG